MIRRLALGAVVTTAIAIAPLQAEETGGASPVAVSQFVAAPTDFSPATLSQADSAAPLTTGIGEALRKRLASLDQGATDEERAEHAALVSFYDASRYAFLWLTSSGELSPRGSSLVGEIKRANEWGLDPSDFVWPAAPGRSDAAADASRARDEAAASELGISLAVLKYGRYARGGRIIHPAEQLSSYLDRRPQFLKPKSIIEGIAAAENPDAYLRGLHPQHPQFKRLRQKYLAVMGRRAPGKAGSPPHNSAEANRLLANMEQWRWMPMDMGELYVWNNIPEYTQRVVKSGEVIQVERIVAGEIGKQTPIFTRPMRRITFKPTWKVPESIKVRELWPSLLKGGGLMKEWELEIHTKDGQLIDWRKLDWTKTDIREYDVIQPNGPKSVMGKVKFSFPNPHTVFMHDTMGRDKYMFNVTQRTFSHGCMRVRNPMRLAEVLLREDQGWDAARVAEAFNNGPLNNEVVLERKIPVHTTYFTAMVGDDGKLQTFPDVYGHERRISLALEGKWDKIVKGRDHLAPVELNLANAAQRGLAEDRIGEVPGRSASPRAARKNAGGGGLFQSIFGTF